MTDLFVLKERITGLIEGLENLETLKVYGRVQDITGLLIKVSGITPSIGESCRIISDGGNDVEAEVVGFREGKILLMATDDISDIRPGARILNNGKRSTIKVSESLMGRILNAKAEPIDDRGPICGMDYPVSGNIVNPLKRSRITEPLDLGIRVINGLLTCGKGQRIGIMAGSGVGKSVLMGMIARFTEAPVTVIALIGERAREVKDFIEKELGESGLKKSVVVVSTAQDPPLLKVRAAFTATAIAEYFRDLGYDVLLLMDSLTRVAQAQREIGLAIGEPPTSRGYTPSVFALFPRLLERAGRFERGSITGIYTVLVEGDDLSDPVADSARAILDGHIVLSRELAMEGLYPAVDVLQSISRLMPDIVSKEHMGYAMRFIETLSTYKKFEDMITLGAYKEGSNQKVDYAIRHMDALRSYIRQGMDERRDLSDSIQDLILLFERSKG
jgi:flagellum-specific ATP synthase